MVAPSVIGKALRAAARGLVGLPRTPLTSKLTRFVLRGVPDGPISTRYGFQIEYRRAGALAAGLRRTVITGDYEPEYFAMIARLVKPGDSVVDVGAHEGFLTLFLAQRVGASGAVLAIEPNPENVDYLRHNLVHNRFDHVEIRQVAISDGPGMAPFYADPDEGAWGSLVPFSHLAAKRRLVVQTESLDRLLDHPSPRTVHFLKVDTEGNELKVFKGAKVTLTRDRPIVCFEVSLTFWASQDLSVDRLLTLLYDYEYEIYLLERDTLRPYRWMTERVCNLFAIPRTRVGSLREAGIVSGA